MAGVDWAAMADRYRPFLGRIGSADDLHDVLWELQGEMGSSHAGVLPPAAGGDPALAQGLLGADVERAEDGTWRIARILPGESSVIGARSPLAARASPRRRAISSLRWTAGGPGPRPERAAGRQGRQAG